MLSGVLCLKQNFREGEDFVLFQWARPGSATAAVFKPDFFGVLCAANGVARTLAGAPARCLHLDVPCPGGEARVTAAYLDFRGALWVVLSEGAEVNEVSAGVGAARLLDACVARLGAGVTEQGSAAWAPGSAARACTEATLTRTLSLLAEGGDFEFNVLRADWLAHAYVSAEAAAARSVAEGPAMWEFRAALLRQLEDLEEDAASGLAEAVNRRAVEAMTDFLSASSGAGGGETDPAGGEGAAARRAPRAGTASAQLTDTQRIRCLRRLRLSVQGSAFALVLPGAAPVLLVDRIRSNTAAAFTALCLGTVDPGLFAPPAAGSAGAANSARMACHFFCPPPPPPSAGAPEGAGAGAGTSASASGEAEAEEAAALGSAALAGAVPPTTVLAARGALAAPCALDAPAARTAPGKLHLVLGAALLPAFARGEELLRPAPGAAPRLPARPEEGARVRAGGGACAAYARAPHLVALVLVLQPPAPGEEEEGGGQAGTAVGAYADGAAAGALGAVEEYAARAAAQAARAGAVAHLGGLLEEGAAAARAKLAPLLQRPQAGAAPAPVRA